jgi:predicted Fe-S protein YdhL (DUF1289 family)
MDWKPLRKRAAMQSMMPNIASPCINVCRLNAEQFCGGCGRTGAEIAEWLAANEARRVAIVRAADKRLRTAQPSQPAVLHE